MNLKNYFFLHGIPEKQLAEINEEEHKSERRVLRFSPNKELLVVRASTAVGKKKTSANCHEAGITNVIAKS